MRHSLKTKVAARLDELSRNPFEAARFGGLERSFVNDILIGKKTSVRGDNLAKLAKGLDWTVPDLLDRGTQEAVSEGVAVPLLYRHALEDNDRIQVSIGALRRSVFHTLRRGKIAESKAETLSHVLVATLSALPDAAVVVRLGVQDDNAIGFPVLKPDDPP